MASDLRDPYQLDRLAKELEERHTDFEPHELPEYLPLAHNNPFLLANEFNSEEFLLSRSHTALPDLRTELRDYLSNLKEDLVKLINDDYEAFISLSTDLRGEGTKLVLLKTPLKDLTSHVLLSRTELQAIQDSIEQKLAARANLREEKALLHLLLKISDSLTRLESLLLISTSTDEEDGKADIPSHLNTSDNQFDYKSTTNQSKHLARVASEYTQLLYHVSKARSQRCAFIDEIQWRVDRIQSTLSADLDHSFAGILKTLTEDKTSSKVLDDKAKLLSDLGDCLRTYDVLHLWRDAEDILRREVMRPFIKKTIHPGTLAAPHSPIMPHTPVPSFLRSSVGSSSLPPRTPYTPFSSVPFRTPFNAIAPSSSSHSPYAYILADGDDPLSNLYSQILRFVDRDLSRIMLLTERVSMKPLASSKLDGASVLDTNLTELAPHSGFEILSNVIWAELGTAIMDELGPVVFATGRPNDFHKHHEKSQAFLRSLEFLAPSLQAVENFRAHPIYVSFEKRWQLPVYFQMRWKEIVTKLEESFATVELTLRKDTDPRGFVTAQANAIWIAITACWSAEIFVPALAFRFWRFTLQLLSRYITWLEKSLDIASLLPNRSVALPSPAASPSNPQRSSTSAQGETEALSDDAMLAKFSLALVDISLIKEHMLTLWHEEISILLPDMQDIISINDNVNVEDVLRQYLTRLTELGTPLSSKILSVLTKRSCEALIPIKSIPSQFRAMSNKKTPSEPSHFLISVLKPVRTFFGVDVGEGPGSRLKDEYMSQYTSTVFEIVSERYSSYVISMRKTEESLRRLKKGKRNTFSLFGSSAPRDDDTRDEERIRTQLIIDVVAFGKEAATLGVDVQHSSTYKMLESLVRDVTTSEAEA